MKHLPQAILSFILLCALAVCGLPVCIPARAEQAPPDAVTDGALQLRVTLFDAPEAYTLVHMLPGSPDSPYLLFLPAGCDRTRLQVRFDDAWMTVNGQALIAGKATDAFAADGTYAVETPKGSFSLRVLSCATLPSIYITTESGSLAAIHADKSYKEAATLSAVADGAPTIAGAALSYLKGRGNSSWRSNEKRCYNLKFKEATGLLGMQPAEKWALISNNMDPTLMRNAIAYTAAKLTRLPHTVDFAFADLYINGSYRGNYLVCERVEVDENRIDIADLEAANKAANPEVKLSDAPRMETAENGLRRCWSDLPNDPADISGGYLLEFEYPDAFDEEPSAFLSQCGNCLIVHTPEHATRAEIDYISGLYAQLEEALLSLDGRNASGRSYLDYIDADSFVDGLLLYEFTGDQDRGCTSWYLYLPAGSQRFVMGPVWDFDQSMEDPTLPLQCARSLAAAQRGEQLTVDESGMRAFLDLLCTQRSFVDLMAARLPSLAERFDAALPAQIQALYDSIAASAQADAVRWNYSVGQRKDLQLPTYAAARTQYLRRAFAQLDTEIDAASDTLAKEADARLRGNGRKLLVPALILAAILAVTAVAVPLLLRRKKKKTQT